MIRISTEVGKFYFTDFISLGSNESAEIDEKSLVLGQLKSLKSAYISNRLIVSSEDRLKVEAEITNKSQTGGGGKVQSVQGEIGDVVLDATEIDLTTGGSIEDKFGELSQVAFSGSYLDLSNRPGGTGEPFTVTPWNPYREDLVSTPFTLANTSTAYSNGHISKKATDPVIPVLIDLGYPNSPEVVLTNGTSTTKTNIQFTPSGTEQYMKTFALPNIESVLLSPVDVFAHNGAPKGAGFTFLVIQLDEGEDITTMDVLAITSKPRNINIMYNNVYLNEPNNYTTFSYSIVANGGTVENNSGNIDGFYENMNFSIKENIFYMGGSNSVELAQYGFDPTKKFAGIFIAQIDSTGFDVTTPFNITLEEIPEQPMILNQSPDLVNMKVNKDASIYIGFEGDINNNLFLGLAFSESNSDLNVYMPEGQRQIDPIYIDSNGDIEFKLNNKVLSLKNAITGQYEMIYSFVGDFLRSFITTQGEDKTDWYFTITDWKKRLILDGILPDNVIDGSVLYITHSGKFAGKDLNAGDYIQLYDNKTNFILNRISDPNAIIDAKVPQLVGDGLKFENEKIAIKLAEVSGLELINNGQLKVSDLFENKYFSYPVLFNRMYEQAYISNQSSSLQLDLTNNVNIYVYKLYPFGQNSFSSINLGTNAFGMAFSMGKTVTMLFTGITSQTYITWPNEFLWANGEVPELVPDQKILVTGIVIGSQWESHTDNKLLCTYSTF